MFFEIFYLLGQKVKLKNDKKKIKKKKKKKKREIYFTLPERGIACVGDKLHSTRSNEEIDI
jgi:hypothetical protein